MSNPARQPGEPGLVSMGSSGSIFEQFRVPIAKSFSFAIPERFRINNPFVLRWVEKLPSEVKREEPLEPARFQGPKHSLDSASKGEDSHDEHRDKRTKTGSALSRHPVTEKHSYRLAKFSRDATRRASFGARRIFSRRSDNNSAESSFRDPPSLSGTPPGTPSTPGDRPRMRFVFAYIPTQYELFNKTATVDGQDVDLELWDTSGDFEQHQLQLLSYLAWDAVFLCFSLDSMARFASAQIRWVDEIRKHCRGAPIALVGLKKDTRIGTGMWAPLYPNLTSRICSAQGSRAADIMRATKYVECSAKTGENVNCIFEEGIRLVFNERAQAAKTESCKDRKMPALGQFFCFA
ncbi:P-loop containing nucleoside triphosphate hydrolase protein [Hypoxylon sp. FL1284]|nr:P-loop containing nucleoside triphosphate hydrolase protein [Hypoxylon sp. FL1284]